MATAKRQQTTIRLSLASLYSEDLAALILDSPYADGLALIARLGGPCLTQSELRGFRDNIDKIEECRLPTLIIHGTDDQIVPFTDAESLLKRCSSKRKRLLRIEGAGHNNLLFLGIEDYTAALREHVARTTTSPYP
jgi:hypothetical protein